MKVPDTYVLLAKKISLRANLQEETELLCQIIKDSGNRSASAQQTELFRRELSMLFDDGSWE